ncbi:MAG: ROK family protein [Thermodesulforhabdaceae bacterium]
MKKEVVVSGDIGGTNVRLALVDRNGTILSIIKKEVKEASSIDPHAFIRAIKSWSKELVFWADRSGFKVVGIGLGIAGKIDYSKGKVLFSPNLSHLNDVPIAAELSAALSLPVVIENDANAFGLGEGWVGSAKDWKNWLGVTLGTGVGGCIVLNGELWRGDRDAGFAGEIGHTTVIPGGMVCNCGKKGCLEAYSSEGGLIRQVLADIQNDWKNCIFKPINPKYYVDNANNITAKVLYKQAQFGDPYAQALFNRFGEILGVAISNVFTTLGIFRAVIGGGVSNAWNAFLPSFEKALREHCSMVDVHKIVITKSLLGDRAALLGSAKCAFSDLM